MYENWRMKKTEVDSNEYMLVADWCNKNQAYQISADDEYVFVEPIPQPTQEELNAREIENLKQYLSATDYTVIKIAEGAATEEEYADIISQRQRCRELINQLGGDRNGL